VIIEKQAYRYSDAAVVLGVSPRTIRRWVDLELLPVVRVTQRTIFVCRRAVEAMMRSPLPWSEVDAKALFAHKRS
jgi:hypothetical protein